MNEIVFYIGEYFVAAAPHIIALDKELSCIVEIMF